MARNLEVSIRIEMNETDAPLSANSVEAEAISSSHFRLVLDGAKSLDMDTELCDAPSSEAMQFEQSGETQNSHLHRNSLWRTASSPPSVP